MRVVWTATALHDLLSLRKHIGQDNRNAAAKIAERLRSSTKKLAAHPEIGRPGRVDSTRELVVPGTPYVLPYRVQRDQLEILAVLHAAQEWSETF